MMNTSTLFKESNGKIMKWGTSMALFLFVSFSAFAQTNIAPLATVTANNCRTGACSTLNDLNFGTCGTQQMWISTSGSPIVGVDYIQWDFLYAKILIV